MIRTGFSRHWELELNFILAKRMCPFFLSSLPDCSSFQTFLFFYEPQVVYAWGSYGFIFKLFSFYIAYTWRLAMIRIKAFKWFKNINWSFPNFEFITLKSSTKYLIGRRSFNGILPKPLLFQLHKVPLGRPLIFIFLAALQIASFSLSPG